METIEFGSVKESNDKEKSNQDSNSKNKNIALKNKEDGLILRRHYFGVVLVLVVVLLWVASSFVTEPFFMTWLSTLTFSFYLLETPIRLCLKKRKRTSSHSEENLVAVDEKSETSSIEKKPLKPMTHIETFKLASIFFGIYFLANYFTNAAFGLTEVGSASILASTSGLFTLIFGICAKQETLTPLKTMAVFISVGGVLLLGITDFQKPGNSLQGNLFSLAGAVLYGFYSVLLKHIIVDESRMNMPLFFGFVGILSAFLLWPFLLILHYTSVEIFSPPAAKILLFLLLNSCFGAFLSNYLWLLAMLMTTPLVVAIGISFNIPLTLLGDYVINQLEPNVSKILSGIAIILGFVVLNLAVIYPQWDAKLSGMFATAKIKCMSLSARSRS